MTRSNDQAAHRADGEAASVVTRQDDKAPGVGRRPSERHQHYRSLFERNPNATYSLDRKGRVVDVNRAFEQLIGHDLAGLRVRSFLRWSAPESVNVSLASFKRALAGETVTYRMIGLRKPGERVDVDVTNLPIVVESAIVGVYGIISDSSARKKMERALLETEQRLPAMLAEAAIGFAVADLNGRILDANAAYCRMVGYGLEELREISFQHITHPDDRAQNERLLREALGRDPGTFNSEKRYLRKDGTIAYTRMSISIVRGEDRRPLHIIGIFEDVSERKGVAEHLRRNESLLQIAGRMAQVGGWSIDLPERRLVWSDVVAAIHDQPAGFSPPLDEGIAAFVPDDQAAIRLAVERCITDGTPYDLEVEKVSARGRRFWARTMGEAERDAQGRIVRIQGAFQEITARKQAEQETRRLTQALHELNLELEARVIARTAELDLARHEAERANQAKSAFLATMSHEIRTPMNGVIGMVDVLRQTTLTRDQAEMVNLIRDSADSLLGIIEDILDFSKIEAGKIDIAKEPMQLGSVVEKVCAMLDHLAVNQDVRLTLFVDPAIPHAVVGDAGRLRQVLLNLVGNAIKFSAGRPQRGLVSMRAMRVEQEAETVTVDVIIADNGIGMDQATLARLFTPFSQADASTTRRFGGTGLGLAISDTLVRLMNGRITVRSTPGEGSVFTVRLPFPRACLPRTEDPGRGIAKGVRCRIVGSELPLAADLGAYLADAGAIVERVPDLAAAAREPSTSLLWLILPDQGRPAVADLREAARSACDVRPHFIVFGWGHQRQPRAEAPDLVTIDADVLTSRMLLRTVAVALGPMPQDASDRREETEVVSLAPLQHDVESGGPFILVAEDNEINRKVMLRQLRLAGYAAEVCVNGREALERWRSGKFALVLTDLHMPEMDGYDLAAAIRLEEGEVHRTRIIAVTANALREEELRCLDAGMDACLTKPVRLTELKAAIEAWLGPAARST
jgi:PAS domain S-box-containing protein